MTELSSKINPASLTWKFLYTLLRYILNHDILRESWISKLAMSRLCEDNGWILETLSSSVSLGYFMTWKSKCKAWVHKISWYSISWGLVVEIIFSAIFTKWEEIHPLNLNIFLPAFFPIDNVRYSTVFTWIGHFLTLQFLIFLSTKV